MTNFKNMKELMTHLMNGGAITNLDDSCKDCWISFYEGNLHYPDKTTPVTNIGNPKNWRPVPIEWITAHVHKNTKKLRHED
jgi:hypothetical protein